MPLARTWQEQISWKNGVRFEINTKHIVYERLFFDVFLREKVLGNFVCHMMKIFGFEIGVHGPLNEAEIRQEYTDPLELKLALESNKRGIEVYKPITPIVVDDNDLDKRCTLPDHILVERPIGRITITDTTTSTAPSKHKRLQMRVIKRAGLENVTAFIPEEAINMAEEEPTSSGYINKLLGNRFKFH